MSRAAKAFLASSILVTGLTVWGVHFIQAREEEVSRTPLPILIPSNPIDSQGNVSRCYQRRSPHESPSRQEISRDDFVLARYIPRPRSTISNDSPARGRVFAESGVAARVGEGARDGEGQGRVGAV